MQIIKRKFKRMLSKVRMDSQRSVLGGYDSYPTVENPDSFPQKGKGRATGLQYSVSWQSSKEQGLLRLGITKSGRVALDLGQDKRRPTQGVGREDAST